MGHQSFHLIIISPKNLLQKSFLDSLGLSSTRTTSSKVQIWLEIHYGKPWKKCNPYYHALYTYTSLPYMKSNICNKFMNVIHDTKWWSLAFFLGVIWLLHYSINHDPFDFSFISILICVDIMIMQLQESKHR